jgi:phage shock protein C
MSLTPLSDPDTGDQIDTGDRAIPDLTTAGRAVAEPGAPLARPLLRRSTSDKVIAGVAGGLARYLGVDPVVVRIAFVALALSGGAGVLLYLIGWIAIPGERSGEITGQAAPFNSNTGVIILGLTLVVAGGVVFAERMVPSISAFVGPLLLIALGLAVLLRARR